MQSVLFRSYRNDLVFQVYGRINMVLFQVDNGLCFRINVVSLSLHLVSIPLPGTKNNFNIDQLFNLDFRVIVLWELGEY